MKNLILLLLATAFIFFNVYYQSIYILPQIFLPLLIVSNVVSFILYGVDKLAALKHKQRIPEKYFYSLALLFGWPASLLGQMLFNHKTTKVKFRRWFYMMVSLNVIFVAYLFYIAI